MAPFYFEEMESPDYDCPGHSLPFSYPAWNSKWYSPLCRPWYNHQASEPGQNTLSDLYIFASADVFGLTPCAPILKQRTESDPVDPEFYGSLCMDINP